MNRDDMEKMFFTFATKLVSQEQIGHAFMFEVDSSYHTSVLLPFVKEIFKSDIRDSKILENIFYLIDHDLFSDLKIIKAESSTIKKEQLHQVFASFKTKSLFQSKKIYIIEYAEDLNISSANTILKFLEEPPKDIIAILITKNKNCVLDTIVSRCQVINFNKYFLNKYADEVVSQALEILLIYEKYQKKAISYLTALYSDKPDNIVEIFTILIYLYRDIICIKRNDKNVSFPSYAKDLTSFVDSNSLESLISKINILEEMIKLCRSNVNYRIILDQMFVN